MKWLRGFKANAPAPAPEAVAAADYFIHDLPLWMVTEQADRLATYLKIEGFERVEFDAFDCGSQLGVLVRCRGLEHAERFSSVMDLPNVVFRFKQWRRDAEYLMANK